VNGRVRCGLSNEDACAAACTQLASCVGYAYEADQTSTCGGRCFLYGPTLANGLTVYAEPVSTTEWEGYEQSNGQIGAASGGYEVVCKRKGVLPQHTAMLSRLALCAQPSVLHSNVCLLSLVLAAEPYLLERQSQAPNSVCTVRLTRFKYWAVVTIVVRGWGCVRCICHQILVDVAAYFQSILF
jgi:hypothetical protein